MAHNEYEQEGEQEPGHGSLAAKLDGALAKYSRVEPRTGLEDRILATLRGRREEEAAAWAWRRWTAAGALAVTVLLIVAVSLLRRPERTVPGAETYPSRKTNLSGGQTEKQASARDVSPPHHPSGISSARRPVAHGIGRSPTVVSAVPRLEQFPSPQPLTEQEQILANYVAQYPDHAALIAQARTEALRRESDERREELPQAPTQDHEN